MSAKTETALEVSGKEIGRALYDAAVEARKKEQGDAIVAMVQRLFDMKAQCEDQIRISKEAVDKINRKLVAVQNGDFSITAKGEFFFLDETLR